MPLLLPAGVAAAAAEDEDVLAAVDDMMAFEVVSEVAEFAAAAVVCCKLLLAMELAAEAVLCAFVPMLSCLRLLSILQGPRITVTNVGREARDPSAIGHNYSMVLAEAADALNQRCCT
jgi:hypothetical protein